VSCSFKTVGAMPRRCVGCAAKALGASYMYGAEYRMESAAWVRGFSARRALVNFCNLNVTVDACQSYPLDSETKSLMGARCREESKPRPRRSVATPASRMCLCVMRTCISSDTLPLTSADHALLLWASPSPRVRRWKAVTIYETTTHWNVS
jgi:hypothetical protein